MRIIHQNRNNWLRTAASFVVLALLAGSLGRAETRSQKVLQIGYHTVLDDDLAKANHVTLDSFEDFSGLTAQALQQHDTVVFSNMCSIGDDNYVSEHTALSAEQKKMLLDWVAAGHKLIIYDADQCGGSRKPDYSFIPFKFETDNPGAAGAPGDDLFFVENDTLGSGDKLDKAHFVDLPAWILDKDNNELGDDNIVKTQAKEWCGHMFGSNANAVSGFSDMYAHLGKGLIIYCGMDIDMLGFSSNTYAPAILRMQLEQPFNPDHLPCSVNVSSGFLISSDPQYQTQQMAAGKTFTFPLRLYSNLGYKGQVKLSLGIQPSAPGLSGSFDPGVVPLGRKGTPVLTLKTSPSAKLQAYTLKVTGTDAAGESHSTPLVLTMEQVAPPPALTPTAESMKAALDASGRMILYINFDFNKATIKPDGEPIIAQVIKLLKDNPDLKLSINGYTDNVGTHDYNVKLSEARAAAVVDALVKAGISADRLSSAGYGDGSPIEDNKTAAGRAKNRRVELVKQ